MKYLRSALIYVLIFFCTMIVTDLMVSHSQGRASLKDLLASYLVARDMAATLHDGQAVDAYCDQVISRLGTNFACGINNEGRFLGVYANKSQSQEALSAYRWRKNLLGGFIYNSKQNKIYIPSPPKPEPHPLLSFPFGKPKSVYTPRR